MWNVPDLSKSQIDEHSLIYDGPSEYLNAHSESILEVSRVEIK